MPILAAGMSLTNQMRKFPLPVAIERHRIVSGMRGGRRLAPMREGEIEMV